MSDFVFIVIAGIVLIAAIGYIVITRTSGSLYPSMYWLNRNKYNSELQKIRTDMQNEDRDYNMIKGTINLAMRFRNYLKRVILETEAIVELLKKNHRIPKTEFEDIIILKEELEILLNEILSTYKHNTENNNALHADIAVMEVEIKKICTCINEITDPSVEVNIRKSIIANYLDMFSASYKSIASLHAQLIKYYHKKYTRE